MGRSRIAGTDASGTYLNDLLLRSITLALGGTTALQDGTPPLMFLDPNGSARIVKMPPNPKLGQTHILVNMASSALIITVQDSGGNALVPPCTPTQNEIATLIWSGATLGWRSSVSLGS